MARKAGTVLDEACAARVANGELSLSELAGLCGVSRQAVWKTFKRRGWSTRPAGDTCQESPGVGAHGERLGAGTPTGTATGAPGAESGPSGAISAAAAPRHPLDPESRSTAPVAPPAAPPLPAIAVADADDLTELTRQAVANAALLAVAQANRILASSQLGAQSLKAAVAAVALAVDQLERAGITLDGTSGDTAPRMIIEELDAAACERIQIEAEREYLGLVEPVDGDELEDADKAELAAV